MYIYLFQSVKERKGMIFNEGAPYNMHVFQCRIHTAVAIHSQDGMISGTA